MQANRTLTIPQKLYERIRLAAQNQHREWSEVATDVLEEETPYKTCPFGWCRITFVFTTSF